MGLENRTITVFLHPNNSYKIVGDQTLGNYWDTSFCRRFQFRSFIPWRSYIEFEAMPALESALILAVLGFAGVSWKLYPPLKLTNHL